MSSSLVGAAMPPTKTAKTAATVGNCCNANEANAIKGVSPASTDPNHVHERDLK
jgi:hypothetical protein